MKYDILLFDADATLFDFETSEEMAFYETAQENNAPATPEVFAIYKRVNLRNWKEYEKGLITKERLMIRRFEQFYEEAGITNGNPEKFDLDYLNALSTKSILFDYSETLVKNLKKAGKRLFLITNGVTKVQNGRVNSSPIKDCFEDVFISEQLGTNKPKKEFFDIISTKIKGYSKDRAIVIGDSLSSDIQGALNAGLDSIWFNLKNEKRPADFDITFEAHSLEEVEKILLEN